MTTRVHPKNYVFVVGAYCLGPANNVLGGDVHWRHLVNTIEPSDVPAKRRQCAQVRQRVHNATAPIFLSAADALDESVTLFFLPQKSPCDATYRQNSLTTYCKFPSPQAAGRACDLIIPDSLHDKLRSRWRKL